MKALIYDLGLDTHGEDAPPGKPQGIAPDLGDLLRVRFLRANKTGTVIINPIAILIATVVVYLQRGSKNAI